MLTINGGDKSFGVFGQGDRVDYDGSAIAGTANGVMDSSRFNEMDPTVCDDGSTSIKYNYLAITIIPKIQDNFVAMTSS